MDYQLIALIFLIPAFIVGFQIGCATKEYPSEEEMIKRIIDSRVEYNMRQRIEAELEAELSKRAAHS